MSKSSRKWYIRAMYRAGASPKALAAELDVRLRVVYRALGWRKQVIFNPQTLRRETVWAPPSRQ